METQKTSSSPIVIVGLIAAVVITAILIWRTDWFQQRFFPENYWTQRVAKLESSVRGYEFSIEHFRLEFAKKTLTAEIEVAQMAMYGIQELAAERVKTEIDVISNLIKNSEDRLTEAKVELDRARSELRRIKKERGWIG